MVTNRIADDTDVTRFNVFATAKSRAPCGSPKKVTANANTIVTLSEAIFILASVARAAKVQTLI